MASLNSTNQSSFNMVVLSIAIIVVSIIIGGSYYISQKSNQQITEKTGKPQSQENNNINNAKTSSSVECQELKEEEIIKIVSNYPEVVDFEKRMDEVSQPIFMRATKENKNWSVQVAELHDTNTATFNWYTLDKCGKFKCSFYEYEDIELIGSSDNYPCN